MLLLIIKSDTFTPLVSTVVHWQSGIADAVPIVQRERQEAGNRRPAFGAFALRRADCSTRSEDVGKSWELEGPRATRWISPHGAMVAATTR